MADQVRNEQERAVERAPDPQAGTGQAEGVPAVNRHEAVVRDMARRAREAQRRLELTTTEERNAALEAIARALEDSTGAILAANREDVAAAEAAGLPRPMIARLRLDEGKLAGVIKGVRAVAALPDPLATEPEGWVRPNGLRIERVRVPLGVIGIIYESRPGVTVDAAVLCLKAGNAVLLKGGKEAARSNAALGEAMSAGLSAAGLPHDLVGVLPPDREAAVALMNARGLVDVLIPRGGAGLIRATVEQSKVPVIETGTGVCHVYVHEAADLAMAREIVLNAKCSNPAVCNAAETLLVDRSVAARFLAEVGPALVEAGVRLRACPEALAHLQAAGVGAPAVEPATEADWEAEYLDLLLAVKVVGGLDEALAHIARYGTMHSEAIVTQDAAAAERFLRTVDAAAVYHNASTRFTDGGEFGFGAEIGISTQKLHARGPMGLAELTTHKYVVRGTGQVR
ncbi:MAG: glutamate-5-semialdehyde dehydrogenase [Symbiobacterium sp.]|uniref:glutamate-5-semialdehyde dehydrogenase n=1 Tax=Symbiobacterium sp. TaxID=1971213 RepID=UPI003463D7BF